MEHPSHRKPIRPYPLPARLPLRFCLFCLWLCLAGCGARLPDSGGLTPVRADRDSAFRLEVSGRWVDTAALRAAMSEGLQRKSIMRPADSADAHTLMVKVEVREMFRAGTVSSERLDWPFDGDAVRRATKAGPLIGSAIGIVEGVEAGSLYSPGSAERVIWAMRVAVGMAPGRTPDRLEEIVVSTGKDGAASRKEAIPLIGWRLAERICEAIRPARAGQDTAGPEPAEE